MFTRFISELKNIEGLHDLNPDSEGCYSLRVNQDHLIYFSQSFDHRDLFMYSSIGNVPLNKHEKLDLYHKLLSANLFGNGTGQGFFALDQRFNQLLLMIRIPLTSLTPQRFITELHTFIDTLTHWKEIVDNLHKQPHMKKKPDDFIKNTTFYVKA